MGCNWTKALTLVIAALFLAATITDDASARHRRHRRGHGCRGGYSAPRCCGSSYGYSNSGYSKYHYAPSGGKGYYGGAYGAPGAYGGYAPYGAPRYNAPQFNADGTPVAAPSPSDRTLQPRGYGVNDAVPPAVQGEVQTSTSTNTSLQTEADTAQTSPGATPNPPEITPTVPNSAPADLESTPDAAASSENGINNVVPPGSDANP